MTRWFAFVAALAAILALGAAPGCKKDGDGAAGDKKVDDQPKLPANDPDPEHGDFTLDEATAGLAGTGALMARISTDKGDLVCELYADKAPKTVASFVGLARGTRPWRDPKSGEWKKTPFFDGLAFHRVMPKFMIQGGDLLSRDYGRGDLGTGGPGYELPDEIAADLKFDRPGRMAMANAGPNTGGSQFFVTEVPRHQLDGGYTIFGQCDEGAQVVQDIARVARDGNDKPATPVTMRVEIFRR